MALNYKLIKIYTSEDLRYQGKPIYDAITIYIRGLKLAARCIVTRGIMGCYENGEIASQMLLDLSYNMPLKIEIIIPSAELNSILPTIETMISDGVVAVETLNVSSYKTSKRLIPNNLKVKDIMTTNPATVTAQTSVAEVFKLILDAPFNGLPVVDETQRVVGIITQNDLSARLNTHLRLGLMAKMERSQVETYLKELTTKRAEDVMSRPVVTVKEGQLITEVVRLMLKQKLKRLPVINDQGLLVGMLSRIDIFKNITKQVPKWRLLEKQAIQVGEGYLVKDVMRRDLDTVKPDTPVLKLLELIYHTEVQRVAVVDQQGCLLGIISDDDLLPILSEHPLGLSEFLVSKLTFTQKGRESKEYLEKMRARTAAEVMTKQIISIQEDQPLDAAIKLMTEKQLKRLPVVDNNGAFQGMISREAVLQKAIE